MTVLHLDFILQCSIAVERKKDTEKHIIHLKNILLFAKLNAPFGFLEGRHKKIQARTTGLFIIFMLIRSSYQAFCKLLVTSHFSRPFVNSISCG